MINIFKAMINFAKNDEFLTIIFTVPFIFYFMSLGRLIITGIQNLQENLIC